MSEIFGYVYVLHNIKNSRKYVGKTNNWKVRKTTHMRTLQKGTHWNSRQKKRINGILSRSKRYNRKTRYNIMSQRYF